MTWPEAFVLAAEHFSKGFPVLGFAFIAYVACKAMGGGYR